MKGLLIVVMGAMPIVALTGCGGGSTASPTVARGSPVARSSPAVPATLQPRSPAATGSVIPPVSSASPPVTSVSGNLTVTGAAPGGMATATMHASAGTLCGIVYVHPSGKASTAAGLDPQTAGADGTVSWTWLVSLSTTTGRGTVIATCGSEQAVVAIAIGVSSASPPTAGAGSDLTVTGAAPGGTATATMHASAGVQCAIVYVHPSGKASTAAGLDPQPAGADGTVSWTWLVSPSTVAGKGTVIVTCGGEQAVAPIVIG